MGSEVGDLVDFNPTVYVALGRNVDEGKSVLKWAVENFVERKICLLHVHQITSLVSILKNGSKLKNQASKSRHEIEPLKMQKLMNQYLIFLSQTGIKADKVWIEMSNIEKGILQLIDQHRISFLIMGAAAETFNTAKKLSEIKSSKSMVVCRQAPLSCHLSFIFKGCLIYSRPVGSASCLTTKVISSSTNGNGKTLIRDPIENNVVDSVEHLTRSEEEVVGPTDSIVGPTSGDDTLLSAKVKDLESLPCSSFNTSMDFKFHKIGTHELRTKLEDARKDAENSNQGAFEESLRRWRAEEDSFEAVRKAEAAENLYKEEMNKVTEIKELLITQNQETEKMKNLHDKLTKEIELFKNQKPGLENRLKETTCLEKELEEKIIQAVNLLITFKETRDKLQIEYDSAIRKINKLRILGQKDPAEISGLLFAGISFADISLATQNFNPSLKIGEGSVFKGMICNLKVAIKMLPSPSSQSDTEFTQEVEILSRVRHPNLVPLLGFSPESRSLIYEYIENGSLEDYLNGPGPGPSSAKAQTLSWQTRIRIALETCSALVFLHAKDHYNVHGNLKPSNILLDSNFVTKVSDFGVHNLLPRNVPEASEYTDPEYVDSGKLTTESDVYSFGIVLLRLLTARPVTSVIRDVKCAMERDRFYDVLDVSAGDWPIERAKQLGELGLRCCENNSLHRPDLVREIWALLERIRDSCDFSNLSSISSCLESRREGKVPSHFLCPIFQEVMTDPHIAADGYTYEADAIQGWFNSGHDTSPMTNLKLGNCELIPNYALYYAIREWQQQN